MDLLFKTLFLVGLLAVSIQGSAIGVTPKPKDTATNKIYVERSCSSGGTTLTLNNVGDSTSFYALSFYHRRSCRTTVESPEGTMQRVSCSVALKFRSSFSVMSGSSPVVQKSCSRFVCASETFSTDVDATSTNYIFNSGPYFLNVFRCSVTVVGDEPPPATDSTCQCGQPKTARIVGGQAATAHEYPFMARLKIGSSGLCGGTLITKDHVLTAAHCFSNREPSDVVVNLGTHNSNDVSDDLEVTEIINHPNYDPSTNNFDITILKLKDSVDFSASESDNIRPVCIPEGDSDYEGTDAVAAGWGTLSSGGSLASELQEVTVPVVSNAVCDNAYPTLTSNMICAGEEGKDSCQGDSGGPLLSQDDSGYYDVIGITSFGRGCGLNNFPGVYTRVTALRNWIYAQVKDSTTCERPTSMAK